MDQQRILEDLNEGQRQAVTHQEGPLMIVAGAGTGKTTVLTRRIAWLIAGKKARPEQVLALAFNDKAAREMEERVDRLVPYGYAPVNILTFHAFGARLFQEHAYRLGLFPDSEVLAGAALRHFIKRRLFKLPLHKFRPLGNPAKHVAALEQLFSRAKDEGLSAEQWLAAAAELKRDAAGKGEAAMDEALTQAELAGAYQAYDAMLHQAGFVDHGDQLLQVVRLLREHPQVREDLRKAYPWILVDEFQDSNSVQMEIIRLLAPPDENPNLCVVGDDDQAIYRFRGASLANILQFKQEYHDPKVVVLDQNYRSVEPVLDAAYQMIQHNNPDRLEARLKISKRLKAAAPPPDTRALFYRAFEQQSAEHRHVVDTILKGMQQGRQAREFAVLVRTNKLAETLVQELRYRGVPSRFTGAKGLYRQDEVRTCLEFLRALADPGDDRHLIALLAGEVYRLPVTRLRAVVQWARRRQRSLFDVLTGPRSGRQQAAPDMDAETWAKVDLALEDLGRYDELARQRGVATGLYEFLNERGYLTALLERGDERAQYQVANLGRFFDKVKTYDRLEREGDAAALIAYLDSLIEEGDDPPVAEADAEADAVTISTIHRAKGLEWPVVFCIGLEEGHFPASHRSDPVYLPGNRFPRPEDPRSVHRAEERRLFYVALTRAKEELHLSWSRDHGGARRWKRSVFLAETLDLGDEEPSLVSMDPMEKLRRLAGKDEHGLFAPMQAVPDDGVLRLSYYAIDDYLSCPLKYKLSHLLKLKPPQTHSMIYGRAMHQAVQRYHEAKIQGVAFGEADLHKALEENWSSEGFLSREHEEQRLANGKEKLSLFFRQEEANGSLPSLVEEPFEISLGSNNRLAGRVDRVDGQGASAVISDYKTSDVKEEKKAREEVRKSLQLAIYALAWEQVHGTLPAKLELRFLESGLRAELVPDAKYMEKKRGEVEAAFAGIRRGDFAATPDAYGACRFCAYRRVCPKSAV